MILHRFDAGGIFSAGPGNLATGSICGPKPVSAPDRQLSSLACRLLRGGAGRRLMETTSPTAICRWVALTLYQPYPCWLDAESQTLHREYPPRPLPFTDVCLTCQSGNRLRTTPWLARGSSMRLPHPDRFLESRLEAISGLGAHGAGHVLAPAPDSRAASAGSKIRSSVSRTTRASLGDAQASQPVRACWRRS
jgi:hypothetical protein